MNFCVQVDDNELCVQVDDNELCVQVDDNGLCVQVDEDEEVQIVENQALERLRKAASKV